MNRTPADLPVILLYNLDRRWPPEDIREALELAHTLASGLMSLGHPVKKVRLEDGRIERALSGCDPGRQVVLNWCEEVPGIAHSGARVARTLESLGFTYTGASAHALAFSQDKPAVKERLFRRHIPTPRWCVYRPGETVDWQSFPAIVKPAYEHCSFGITPEAVVQDQSELSKRVQRLCDEFQQPILVEDFIDGREFHVGVVGNGRLQVLPVAEMDFSAIPEVSGHLCTYDSKFTPASRDYQMIQIRLPAALPEEKKKQLEKTALAAYRITGCRDYARMDIRERNGIFYVLDVNHNADISPDTSLILSAELAGFSYAEFGSLLVKLAAHRHPLLNLRMSEQDRSGLAPAVISN